MSNYKKILKTIEFITLLVLVLEIVMFVSIFINNNLSNYLSFFIAVSVFIVLVNCCFAMLLFSEMITATRKLSSLKKSSDNYWKMAFGAIKWCPTWIGALSIATLVGLALLAHTGRFYWQFGDELTAATALSITSSAAAMCSLFLPIISSAIRMPGNYAQFYRHIEKE